MRCAMTHVQCVYLVPLQYDDSVLSDARSRRLLQDAEMRSIRAEAKLAHQTSFANVRHYAKKTLRALDGRVPGGICVTDWRS